MGINLRMKHLAAYALLILSGNANPTEADIENLLAETGVEADKTQLKKLMESIKGKSMHELIAEGLKKMQMGGRAEEVASKEKDDDGGTDDIIDDAILGVEAIFGDDYDN
eukprot:TRINITY_DN15_c0_g1_i4.p1 TRINITY_DN15_c0_g1~~TRINITY_DN15_c0_g1_i4.p1  ORF type:complete len:110 (+),score=37.81 TRINITY_DN15_c0_g1_i4:131-460(+)